MPVFTGLSPNTRGILAMTGASILFVFSDALAKYAAQYWPIAQILAVRGFFAIALGIIAVLASGEMKQLHFIARRPIITRSATEGFTALSFLSALPLMPIADLTSILMLSPLVITAIATLFFGEVVGWRRWGAIVFGFAGMVFVVQPSGIPLTSPHYYTGALLGLCAVVGVAMRDLMTRQLAPGIPSVIVTLGAGFGSCAAGLLMSLRDSWAEFAWAPLICCIIAAFIVTTGNLLIILACRGADLSLVAPYRFSSVIWAILLGALVFSEFPNWTSIIGMAMIAASGVYTLHRERIRRAQAHLDSKE